MKIGLSGQMFDSTNVWEHLDAAALNGYECVELRGTHISEKTDEATLCRVRDALQSKGLAVSALSCFTGNYALLDEAGCEQAYEVFTKYVEIAAFLGAGYVRTWPGWVDSAKAYGEMWERAVRWMRKSGEYAAARGCGVLIEMHHGTLCDNAQSSAKFVDEVGLENVGLTLDIVNLYQACADYGAETIRMLGTRILNVHIKDIVALTDDAEPGCFHYAYYATHIGRFTRVIPPDASINRYYAHRRISQGGVDWASVLRSLKDIGYDGALVVESVSEQNPAMPVRGALAAACMHDVKELLGEPLARADWKHQSPEVPGFHTVIAPGINDCQAAYIYRLNLLAGTSFRLCSKEQEMNAALISGQAAIRGAGLEAELADLDSFYIPGECEVEIQALADCVFYIGAALCEGYGKPFWRRYDLSLPIGDIHQIHGSGSGEREVFFTLDPGAPASRLLCGLTFSRDGAWTSWPPHQHERDLEEVYCYYAMPAPHFGLHLSYTKAGGVQDLVTHVVNSGTMVLAPRGYHPTVSSPGTVNHYFWVLAAFSHPSRRYDLAVNDPTYEY